MMMQNIFFIEDHFRLLWMTRNTGNFAVLLISTLLTLLTVAPVPLEAYWIFVTVLGIAVTTVFSVLAWLIIPQQKLSSNQGLAGDDNVSLEKVAGILTKFCYEDLLLATDNFSSILGQGGSGCVFRGMLKDGTSVAVKRMDGKESAERVFQAELATMGCVQHINLVQLYGYCVIPKGPRFLVYEFIQNGSLDCRIFPQKHNNHLSGCLPWKLRYKVAIDVAKGLSYLHNNSRSRILHLDVKPQNILLDNSYRALVSDFGLAKLMGKEESLVVKRVCGTKGYLAPEWILQSRVSAKSDVYSYGMLLLEMIGGRRNVSMPVGYGKGKSTKSDITWEYFPKTVFEKLKAGKLMEVVDKRLLEVEIIDENELRRLVYVALWCIQEKVKLRPNMAQVVDMLECRIAVDQPPETEMFLLDLLLIKMKNNCDQHRLKASALQTSQYDNSTHATSATTS